MKKVLSIIVLVIISASCTNQDTSSSIDPTMLAKVIFNPGGGESENHWSFYENGLLKDIKKPDGTILESFIYDENNNLLSNIINNGSTTTTHTFTYDNDGHMASVNGIPIIYNAAENAYIKTQVGGDTYTDTYYLNEDQLLIRQESRIDTSEGVTMAWTDYGGFFNNGDLTFYFESPIGEAGYHYFTHTNPLKATLLPILRTTFIIDSFRQKWYRGVYSSDHNVDSETYDSEGGESTQFAYEFNTIGLPISLTHNNYSFGNFEGSITATLYYYQGDVIP